MDDPAAEPSPLGEAVVEVEPVRVPAHPGEVLDVLVTDTLGERDRLTGTVQLRLTHV